MIECYDTFYSMHEEGLGKKKKMKLKKWESRNLIRQNFWQQAEHSKPYYDQLQMLQIEPFVTPVSQLRDLNFCIRGTSLLQQQLEMCLKHCCYCCFSWTPFVSSCCVCVCACVCLPQWFKTFAFLIISKARIC